MPDSDSTGTEHEYFERGRLMDLREALWSLHQADHDTSNDETWCSSCHVEWPCPTAQVLLGYGYRERDLRRWDAALATLDAARAATRASTGAGLDVEAEVERRIAARDAEADAILNEPDVAAALREWWMPKELRALSRAAYDGEWKHIPSLSVMGSASRIEDDRMHQIADHVTNPNGAFIVAAVNYVRSRLAAARLPAEGRTP